MGRAQDLREAGQSLWYDFIQRSLIASGTLARLVAEDGLAGMTSNPTIFEKAIGHSTEYDAQVRDLDRKGTALPAILDALTADDIRAACDVFKPLYDETVGQDGRVSIEVAPEFARDPEATIGEGRRLRALVDRRNVMVKVPATKEGLRAIEALTAEAVDVNVTLIFSVARYREVMDAYLKGLEARAGKGLPLDRIHSVASFFVSRIDVAANKRIEARLPATAGAVRERLAALKWRIAIANSKRAYRAFREVFTSDRFRALAAKGACVQRVLWASTGAKDPSQPPLFYINQLTARDSVDTVPPEAFAAFLTEGVTEPVLGRDPESAEKDLAFLAEMGISLEEICEDLEEEGLKSFAKSWDTLRQELDAKRRALAGTA